MKTGWIVEKRGEHLGAAHDGWGTGKTKWVPFDDPELVVLLTREDALAFMLSFDIEDGFVCEHAWYENEI